MNHLWPPQVSRALHELSEAAPDAPSLTSVLEHGATKEIAAAESSAFTEHRNRRRVMIVSAAVAAVIAVAGVVISSRSSGDRDLGVAVGPTTIVPSLTTVAGSPATGVNGWVAFTAQGVVYLVRDGEAPHAISVSGSDRVLGACPAFSPDGGRLMFVQPSVVDPAGEHAELVVVTVGDDGTAAPLATVPLPTNDACALWAPDGRWAAYAADDSVWVVDTTTGDVREVAGQHAATDIEWRPGTDELAITGDCCTLGGAYYLGGLNGPIDIYSVSSGETRTIPDVEANDITWSPDGATLAYTEADAPASGASGISGIWLVDADGTNVRQLTTSSPHSTADFGIVWSPRGGVIAYQRGCDDGGRCGDVVLVATSDDDPAHPQGTERIIAPPGTDTGDGPVTWWPDMITWSPDGTELLYTARGFQDGSCYTPFGQSCVTSIIAVPIDAGQPASVLTPDIDAIRPDFVGQWRLSQQWGRSAR